MHLIGVNNVTHAVDIEVMWFCYWRRLRCLEVNPALIGMYIVPGSGSKISDNNAPGWEPESENPIGPQSVKAMMSDRLDPNLDRDV